MLQYHPLIARSKALLDSSRDLHGGCGGGFVIRLYLILVISGQNRETHALIEPAVQVYRSYQDQGDFNSAQSVG